MREDVIVIEKLEIVFEVEAYSASPNQRDAGLIIFSIFYIE